MNDMITLLPYYYIKSELTADIYDVIQQGINDVKIDIKNTDENLFILTANDFILHEKDVGIISNSEISDETRRANVISKIRGSSVLTVSELERLITVYEPTGVEVKENYSEYTVILNFKNCEGQPKNILEILTAIEEVKPAHIQIKTEYVRNPYGKVNICGLIQKSGNITFMTVDAMRYMNLKGEVYTAGVIQKEKIKNLAEV